VALVGVGADGHILSAFPGSALFDSEAWVAAVPAPEHIEPHIARISLNPRILGLARLPIVVAHGAGKAAIMATVLGTERDERRWPAQVARREGALWFLDRAAAAELPPAPQG
jgi:6-phosphogluconolactonase